MKRVSCCCNGADRAPVMSSRAGVLARIAAWFVPSLALAAMPKCPLCLAAYVTLLTGCGISLAAANYTWWFIVSGSVALLLYLATKAVLGLLHR